MIRVPRLRSTNACYPANTNSTILKLLPNNRPRSRHHLLTDSPSILPTVAASTISFAFSSPKSSFSTLTSACCKCRPYCCLSGKGTCSCCRRSSASFQQKLPRNNHHSKTSTLTSPSTPSFQRLSSLTRQFSTSSITMATEYKLKGLASLKDIPNMEKVEAEVEGVQDGKVLVVRLEDKFHAISPRCTHYGAPLKLGVVAPDGRITCPWHGGTFLQYQRKSYFHYPNCFF